MARAQQLHVVPGEFAIVRLPPEESIPTWVGGGWYSITRTPDETSVVCASDAVPDAIEASKGWSMLGVTGTLEFDEIGVLASLSIPLRNAGISLFVVSTFDTDYILVSNACLGEAIAALEGAGHRVSPTDSPGE